MANPYEKLIAENPYAEGGGEPPEGPPDTRPVTMAAHPYVRRLRRNVEAIDPYEIAPQTAALGRGMTVAGQGVKQFALEQAEKLGIVKPTLSDLVTGSPSQRYTRQAQAETDYWNQIKPEGFEGSEMVGQALPFMALPGGAGASTLGRLLSGAAAGAAGGGLTFVPEDSKRTRGEQAGIGALLGLGVQAPIEGVRAVAPQANRAVTAAAEKARQWGILPTPGKESTSPMLNKFEMFLENTFGGGLVMDPRNQANQRAFNRGVLKTIGVNDDQITREVMGKAKSDISAKFEAALTGQTIRPDNQFVNDLVKLINSQQMKPDVLQEGTILKLLNDPKMLNNIDGKIYNEIRSDLGKKAVDADRAGRSSEAILFNDVQEALDNLATRSLPMDKASTLAGAREQWRNLQTIRGALDPSTGKVSPQKLSNSVYRKNKGATFGGKGDLIDAADISQFLRQGPDSGTAARIGSVLLPTTYGAGTGGAGDAAENAAYATAAPSLLALAYLKGAGGLAGAGRTFGQVAPRLVPGASSVLLGP